MKASKQPGCPMKLFLSFQWRRVTPAGFFLSYFDWIGLTETAIPEENLAEWYLRHGDTSVFISMATPAFKMHALTDELRFVNDQKLHAAVIRAEVRSRKRERRKSLFIMCHYKPYQTHMHVVCWRSWILNAIENELCAARHVAYLSL